MRASIALMALAIGLVGFIQYSWFRQSAAAEIEGAFRSLNATVFQTMSREFQRYAPLLVDLRGLRSVSGPPALRAALGRTLSIYGPEGSVPRLVSTVGVASLRDPSTVATLRRDGAWASEPSAFALPIPDSALRQLADGEIVACSGKQGADRQFILALAYPGALAVVELDAEGFFGTYIKPAVASVLPASSIEWTRDDRAARSAPEGKRPRVAPPRRSFNPLRALLGAAPKEGRTFPIIVPATMDAFIMRGSGWFDSWAPGEGGEGSYRPLESGEFPDPRASSMMRVAKVEVSSSSVVGSVERRLSINLLVSVLLLLGLGLAFAAALLQKHKIGVIQRREREFVASVTHELRTPVTAIRSAADNMRRGLVGLERMAPYGEMIHAQSLRLGSMIEEVLLFSQVEGKAAQSPVYSTVDSGEFLEELRAPLEAIAKAEGIDVDWDFGSLPRSFRCDAEALRLIVSNLVANALNHAYVGPERGGVRVIGKACLPGALQFFVEDDGRGIPKAEAALVFEPFYRDEESRSRHEKGSGLGLFIARRKARLLGGELALESPYARIDGARRPGCRFTLELPIKEQADDR